MAMFANVMSKFEGCMSDIKKQFALFCNYFWDKAEICYNIEVQR